MGRVWKFGDSIDTDTITPAQYLTSYNKDEYVPHAMEPVAPNFGGESEKGDVIIAGTNFGCGSSRESAPIALKENGIQAVVAKSFARIFFRNSINIGLPVFICSEAHEKVDDEDDVEIDFENSAIINKTKSEKYIAERHPEFIRNIIDHGGIAEYRKQLE